MDDRARLRQRGASTPRRRSSSTTSSRASAPRAPSGSSNTSGILRCGCSTAVSAPGPAARFRSPATARRPPTSTWKGERRAGRDRDVARRPGAPSGSRTSVILDTRSDGEYCGTTVRAARGGAIPGAVHIEWTRNLTPDGAFKPADRAQSGCTRRRASPPTATVITYCQAATAPRIRTSRCGCSATRGCATTSARGRSGGTAPTCRSRFLTALISRRHRMTGSLRRFQRFRP